MLEMKQMTNENNKQPSDKGISKQLHSTLNLSLSITSLTTNAMKKYTSAPNPEMIRWLDEENLWPDDQMMIFSSVT